MSTSEKLYNVCYNGRALYQSMTLEDCTEILQEFSERFFSGEDIDPNLISLEPLFEN
jgi:(2Fe-2S) ferredoxin